MRIPDPDPGELWTDMNSQLFGMPNVGSPAPIPTMDGFVKNYVNQPANAGQTFDPKNVMHYFTPKQVPVISQLARQFAVSDRWFASAPCQTWPNRWFVPCRNRRPCVRLNVTDICGFLVQDDADGLVVLHILD
jgi:phospholipase C